MLTEVQIEAIRARAGIHATLGQPVPEDQEQKLYYGLLEILDSECITYGDAPEGVTEDDIKQYLIEHKGSIKSEACPSFLGLCAGVFDFLSEANGEVEIDA